MAQEKKQSLLEKLGESQVWKSIIRSGVPRSRRQRMYAVLGNVFLRGHPVYLLSGGHQASGIYDGNQKPEPGFGDRLQAAPLQYHQSLILFNNHYS